MYHEVIKEEEKTVLFNLESYNVNMIRKERNKKEEEL